MKVIYLPYAKRSYAKRSHASQKLHALSIIINYMELEKRIELIKTFSMSQFHYRLLVFFMRKLGNYIGSMHKGTVRIVDKEREKKTTLQD